MLLRRKSVERVIFTKAIKDLTENRHYIIIYKHKNITALPKIIATKQQINVKNGIFWDVKPCGCCKNRRFGGT
jgi:hypothetical protein